MTRKFLLAPLALLGLWAMPASAQSVTGCSSVPANRVATSTDAVSLGRDADCAQLAADKIITPRRARIAALAPATAPSADWKPCASEGSSCTIHGTGRVRFGAGERWKIKTVTGTIACSNAAFAGDPAPGVAKSCQTTGSVVGGAAPSPTAPSDPAPTQEPVAENGWTRCATEGGQCLLAYDTKARFGAPGAWQYADVRAGQLGCGAGPGWGGGDPAPGKQKVCDYVPRTGLDAPLAVATGMQVGVNVAHVPYYSGQPTLANLMTGEKWRALTDWEPRRSAVVDNVDNLHLGSGDRAAKNLTIPIGVLKGQNTPIVCTWEGKGTTDIGGQRSPVFYGNHRATFTYLVSPSTRGELVWFTVTSQDGKDPIRNIDCREASLPREAVFHPAVLEDLKHFKVLRFLDWSAANANPDLVTWEGRTRPESGNQAEGPTGAAFELQVALARETGADAWFTIPWNADEDYQRRAAQYAHDNLPAGQKVYAELSNEVWNWTFRATHQASKEGIERGLSSNGGEALILRYAEKAREMMAIWSAVFADRPGQLVRVGAFQFGAGSIDTGLGKGKLADSIDVIAVAPYIGNDLVAANPGATDPAVFLAGLDRDIADRANTIAAVKNVARRYGKRLVAYEAGQHITGGNIETVRAVQRSPELEGIYRRYLAMWRDKVNDLIVHYTDTGSISTYGSWGAREYTGQPLSETPKLRALLEAAH